MLFHAYIDDSADRRRDSAVVSGAIIGKRQDWYSLNGRWKARLKEDGLQYFKSSQCETLNGQFYKFRSLADGKTKAEKVRKDLDEIVRNSPVTTLGVVLSVPFHKTMLNNPVEFGKIPLIPYHLAFQQILAECCKAMLTLGRDNIVAFGHDDSADFHVLHEIYKAFKKSNPRYAKIMTDFVPLDDKLHPPVQAADVAAWITSRYAMELITNPSTTAVRRLQSSMYKIVSWLEDSKPGTATFDDELTPAKAVYVILA